MRRRIPKNATKKEILEIVRERIENEIPYVGIKPYSSNIISINLRIAAERCGGNKTANKLIDEFELEDLGWNKEEV